MTAERSYARWDLDRGRLRPDGRVLARRRRVQRQEHVARAVLPDRQRCWRSRRPTDSEEIADLERRHRGTPDLLQLQRRSRSDRPSRLGATVAARGDDAVGAWRRQATVKIGIRKPGWYRVTKAELVAAGLAADVDPADAAAVRRRNRAGDSRDRRGRRHLRGDRVLRLRRRHGAHRYADLLAPGRQRGRPADRGRRGRIVGAIAAHRLLVDGAPQGSQRATPRRSRTATPRTGSGRWCVRNPPRRWTSATTHGFPPISTITPNHIDRSSAGNAQLTVALQGMTSTVRWQPEPSRRRAAQRHTTIGDMDEFAGQAAASRPSLLPWTCCWTV